MRLHGSVCSAGLPAHAGRLVRVVRIGRPVLPNCFDISPPEANQVARQRLPSDLDGHRLSASIQRLAHGRRTQPSLISTPRHWFFFAAKADADAALQQVCVVELAAWVGAETIRRVSVMAGSRFRWKRGMIASCAISRCAMADRACCQSSAEPDPSISSATGDC